jgi:hypothetical protein
VALHTVLHHRRPACFSREAIARGAQRLGDPFAPKGNEEAGDLSLPGVGMFSAAMWQTGVKIIS